MIAFLWIVFIAVCFLLIVVVLLQPGEGQDLAATFGGGSSQTAFGARSAATFLMKVTSWLAALFMVLAIAIGILSSKGTSKNILSKQPDKKPAKSAPAENPKAPAKNPVPQGTK